MQILDHDLDHMGYSFFFLLFSHVIVCIGPNKNDEQKKKYIKPKIKVKNLAKSKISSFFSLADLTKRSIVQKTCKLTVQCWSKWLNSRYHSINDWIATFHLVYKNKNCNEIVLFLKCENIHLFPLCALFLFWFHFFFHLLSYVFVNWICRITNLLYALDMTCLLTNVFVSPFMSRVD